jgi:hypothetical protein
MDNPLAGNIARMEAAQVDFQQLRIKHILYKTKLRSVLYGGSFEESFFSPSGPLGHWFNTIGLTRYGQYPEMRELFQLHQQLNSFALQLIGLYRRGQIDQAHHELKDLDERSEQFLAVLSRLEKVLRFT